MSGFSADWLALRAPFDDRARSAPLARAFARRLPAAAAIVDLGAGTGASRRALGPVVGPAVRWTFVEGDPALLAAALASTPGARGVAADLSRGVGRLLSRHADAVTAFALLDLASGEWIEALAAALVHRSLPLYAPLIVDGRGGWSPHDPDDRLVDGLFARHQRRPKGLGRGNALGPLAPMATVAAFRRRGWRVATARSDWRVGGGDRAMLHAMIDGAAAAAGEQSPADRGRIAGWADRRRRQADDGRLTMAVGHRDILAVPLR